MAPHLPQQVSELGMNLPSNGKELEVLLSTSRPYSSLGHHWLWLHRSQLHVILAGNTGYTLFNKSRSAF